MTRLISLVDSVVVLDSTFLLPMCFLFYLMNAGRGGGVVEQ